MMMKQSLGYRQRIKYIGNKIDINKTGTGMHMSSIKETPLA